MPATSRICYRTDKQADLKHELQFSRTFHHRISSYRIPLLFNVFEQKNLERGTCRNDKLICTLSLVLSVSY